MLAVVAIMVVKLAVQVTMEPGPDVPDKATKVDNKEVQPEMGPTKVDIRRSNLRWDRGQVRRPRGGRFVVLHPG